VEREGEDRGGERAEREIKGRERMKWWEEREEKEREREG